MLRLIEDFRSGCKMELVIPVWNEQKRIDKLIECYAQHFDIVLLDGGSTDRTLELAHNASVTTYAREAGGVVGEDYFAYYANGMSKSGCSFWLFADEFFEKAELVQLYEKIKAGGSVILGNRIDWCYGHRMRWRNSILPRGFFRGDAIFNPENIHMGLRARDGLISEKIDIQHLQLWDMTKFLGQSAAYAHAEIARFYEGAHPFYRFFRRFFVFELIHLPLKIWNQRKLPFAFQMWQIAVAFIMPMIGTLCLIEQRWLMSPEEQLRFYRTFYDEK